MEPCFLDRQKWFAPAALGGIRPCTVLIDRSRRGSSPTPSPALCHSSCFWVSCVLVLHHVVLTMNRDFVRVQAYVNPPLQLVVYAVRWKSEGSVVVVLLFDCFLGALQGRSRSAKSFGRSYLTKGDNSTHAEHTVQICQSWLRGTKQHSVQLGCRGEIQSQARCPVFT